MLRQRPTPTSSWVPPRRVKPRPRAFTDNAACQEFRGASRDFRSLRRRSSRSIGCRRRPLIALGGRFALLGGVLLFLLFGRLDGPSALPPLDELYGVANVLLAILRTLHAIPQPARPPPLLNKPIE